MFLPAIHAIEIEIKSPIEPIINAFGNGTFNPIAIKALNPFDFDMTTAITHMSDNISNLLAYWFPTARIVEIMTNTFLRVIKMAIDASLLRPITLQNDENENVKICVLDTDNCTTAKPYNKLRGNDVSTANAENPVSPINEKNPTNSSENSTSRFSLHDKNLQEIKEDSLATSPYALRAFTRTKQENS